MSDRKANSLDWIELAEEAQTYTEEIERMGKLLEEISERMLALEEDGIDKDYIHRQMNPDLYEK